MYPNPSMNPMYHHMYPMMQSPCWHCMMSGMPMEHCPIMLEEMKKYEYEMKKKVKIKRDEEDMVFDGGMFRNEQKKSEVNITNIINIIEVEAPDIMSSLKATGLSTDACKRIIIRIAELTHKHLRED
jgi:hypothetical protein